MYKKILYSLIGLIIGYTTCCQPIGTSVPDLFVHALINDSIRTLRLGDYKDKLLIIDFWSTRCSGCVAGLPHMMALQREFGDRVKILPVTNEEASYVRRFLRQNKRTKDFRISSAVEDKVLARYFKHAFIPHEVWIYKGKLVGVTASDYVTAGNIQSILAGQVPDWPVKNDFLPLPDPRKPMLRVDSTQFLDSHTPVSYAALLGYRAGAGNADIISHDTVRHTRRHTLVNHTVFSAYMHCWGKADTTGLPYLPDPNRVLMEVKDMSRYQLADTVTMTRDLWQRKYLICVESVSPDTGLTIQQEYRKVVADLDYLLGVHGRFETRKTRCLALVVTDSSKLQTSGSEAIYSFTLPGKVMQGGLLRNLVWKLNQYADNPPVLDETGYNGAIDLFISADKWTNIAAIRHSLQAYGLDLQETEKEIKLFVLTETK